MLLKYLFENYLRKVHFMGIFTYFFTGLQIFKSKQNASRNPLDFRTTASSVGPKKCFQNKTNLKPKKGT